MRSILAAALLLAGCSNHSPERLERLYEAAAADVRTGDLLRAQAEVDRGMSLAAARHEPRLEWRFRLLRAEILLFSRSAEPALAQISKPMPESVDFAPLGARKLLLQGQALSLLGRADDARAAMERAHQSAEAAGAADVLAEVEISQGNVHTLHRRYDQAELVLRRALDRAHAAGLAYQEASAALALGFVRINRSRYDDAAPYFDQASRLVGPKSATLYSAAQQNLAMCYSGLGEYDRAIAIQLGNVDRIERTGAKAYLDAALGELGRSFLLKGDLRRAVGYLERALTVSTGMNSTRTAAVWASNLASVYIELGEWDKAAAMNQTSIRLRTSAKLGALYYNELNAASIALGRGDLAAAAQGYIQAMKDSREDPSVLWESEQGLGALAAAGHRPAEAVRHFDAAVAMVEKTRSGIKRTDLKLPFLTRLIRLYRAYVDTLLQEGEVERALAVADSSRAQVLAERSGADPVRRLAPGAFRDLARRTNSVLLSYWLGPRRSHAWVVTAREIHHVELPPASAIEPLIATYQEAVELQLADPARTRLPAGKRLFAMLIEPVRRWIPAGSNVIVTPDGALHGLNLESLPVPPAQSALSKDTPRYWIQEVTVSIAPSLALLAGGTQRAPAAKRLLLLGDPVGADPAYPPLKYAAAEMAGVTQRFGGETPVLLSRENATPDAYAKADPSRFSAIHFTAHATANRESPLDSAVLLAGGKLYARDVMGIKLTANLVTVSACRGVGIRQYSGEGLVGFAWAFLHAGARNVIAGLWDVNDESTSRFMDVLYRELAAGISPAEALHTAKISLAESAGNLRKPYYWAPFQLYTVAP